MTAPQPRAARCAAADPSATSSAAGILAKTRLCRNFESSGRCPRGGDCNFAHGQAEVRPQPKLFKTRWCPEFRSLGACTAGEACTFAHGRDERRRAVIPRPTVDAVRSDDAAVTSALAAQAQCQSRQQEQQQQPEAPRGQPRRPMRGQREQLQQQEDRQPKPRMPKRLPHSPRTDAQDMRMQIELLKAQVQELQAQFQQPQNCRSAAPALRKGSDRGDREAFWAAGGMSCSSTRDVLASLPPTGSDCCLSTQSDELEVAQEVEKCCAGEDEGAAFECEVVVRNTFLTLVPRALVGTSRRSRSAPPAGRDASLRIAGSL